MRSLIKKYTSQHRKKFIILIIGTVLANGLSTAYGYSFKFIIDSLINQDEIIVTLLYICALFGILIVNTFITFYSYTYLLQIMKVKMSNELKKELFRSLLTKPFNYHKNTDMGKLISQSVEDTNKMGEYIALYHFMYVSNIIRFIFVFVIMTLLSPILMLVSLTTIPIYYFSIRKSFNILSESRKEERGKFDVATESFREKINNIETIKVFSKENYFRDKYKVDIEEWFDSKKKVVFWDGLNRISKDFVVSITPIVVLVVGVFLVNDSSITIGSLVAFTNILYGAYIPVSELVYFQSMRHDISNYYNRFKEVANDETSKVQNISYTDGDEIVLRNVKLSFNNKKILNNINITFKYPGIYKLNAPNGYGKTTLFRLLKNLYPLENGSISVPKGLKISYLTQQDEIFTMSSLENITLHDHETMPGEILCPDKMSGGEKKIVSIERVLYNDSDVLLLDEPFDSLDIVKEKEVIEKLKVLGKEKLIIFVSHSSPDFKYIDVNL